jgi:tetratricopeptide (TPR) repeat protein
MADQSNALGGIPITPLSVVTLLEAAAQCRESGKQEAAAFLERLHHIFSPRTYMAIQDVRDSASDCLSVRDAAERFGIPIVPITAAIIMKNEQATILRCIESLKPAVDDIVIVDTGSDDQSIALVEQAGYTVHRFEWCEDFSAARNYALSLIRTDWVLCVDADEFLEFQDREHPRLVASLFDCLHHGEPVLGQVVQANQTDAGLCNAYNITRLFNLHAGIRYEGKIHEQPVVPGEYVGEVHRPELLIRLHHDGYMPEMVQQKRKLDRNVNLLREQVRDHPEQLAGWFYLGRDLLIKGEHEEALAILLEAEKIGDAQQFALLGEIRKLIIETLIHLNRLTEAAEWNAFALAHHPDYPDLHYLKGFVSLLLAIQMLEGAVQSFEHCKQLFSNPYSGPDSVDERLRDWRADLGIADSLMLLGNMSDAKRIYDQIMRVHPVAEAEIAGKLQHMRDQVKALVHDFLS